METIIFAGISLIILIPVMYFLPLGIGVKGKLVLIGASLAAALAGLAASLAYPFWQAALFSLLLTAVFTYLLDKKGGRFASQPAAAAEGFVKQGEDRVKPAAVYMQEAEDEYIPEQLPASDRKEPAVQEELPFIQEEEVLTEENQTGLPADPARLSEEEIKFLQSEEAAKGEWDEMNDSSEDADLEELFEETFDIKGDEAAENDGVIEEIRIKEHLDSGDVPDEADAAVSETGDSLAELEEILPEITEPFPDEEISMAAAEPEQGWDEETLLVFGEEADLIAGESHGGLDQLPEVILEDGPAETKAEPEAGFLNEMDTEVEAAADEAAPKAASWTDTLTPLEDWEVEASESLENTHPTVSDEMDSIEYLESAEETADEGEGQEACFGMIEPLQEDLEQEPELDTLEKLEILELESFDIIDDFSAEPPVIDQPLKPERLDQLLPEGAAAAALEQLEIIDPIIPGESAVHPVPAKEDTARIRQELFNTVLAELQAAKQHRGGTEFERFAAGCLTDQLPDQHYYTIASLLADHYIETGQAMKLHALLAGLEAKFQHYPVILSEIHYIYDRYCAGTVK